MTGYIFVDVFGDIVVYTDKSTLYHTYVDVQDVRVQIYLDRLVYFKRAAWDIHKSTCRQIQEFMSMPIEEVPKYLGDSDTLVAVMARMRLRA